MFTPTPTVLAIDPLPVTSSPAYLLISHGSRDSRSQSAVDRLAQLVREQLRRMLRGGQPQPPVNPPIKPSGMAQYSDSRHLRPMHLDSTRRPLTSPQSLALSSSKSLIEMSPTPIVGTACLELGPCPLHQQVYQFSQRVKAAGINRVRVLPLFLFEGVHVMEDIPMEMTLARQILDVSLELTLCPHLGSHLGLRKLLADRIAEIPSAACLLIAHGSRRPGGNKPIEEIARHLGAIAAYWSVPPRFRNSNYPFNAKRPSTSGYFALLSVPWRHYRRHYSIHRRIG